MKCPNCGSLIPDDSVNCPECRTPIIKIKPLRVCTNCGSEVPDEADKCPGCGRSIRRKAHQKSSFDSASMNHDSANYGESSMKKEKSNRFKLIEELKREKYAWLEAILPVSLAFIYHIFVLRQNIAFNLVNTFIILESFTFYFGFNDIKELSKRPEMMEGLVYSEKYVYMTYFLPILSLWERRQLPGMNRKSLYPLIHTILFTILIFSIMIKMDAQAVSGLYL